MRRTVTPLGITLWEISNSRLWGMETLDIPAMNQQEGTLTNMHKRVTPTNAGLEYHGYELNDIMARGACSAPKYTIDWTPELPTSKGFKSIEFDALPDHFENDGTEKRGSPLGCHHQGGGQN